MRKPNSEWLTVTQVADLEDVSTETIRRGIKAGKYPASRMSAAPKAPWVIDASAYAEQREAAAQRHWNVRRILDPQSLRVVLVVDRTLVEDMPADAMQRMLGEMAYSKIRKMLAYEVDCSSNA